MFFIIQKTALVSCQLCMYIRTNFIAEIENTSLLANLAILNPVSDNKNKEVSKNHKSCKNTDVKELKGSAVKFCTTYTRRFKNFFDQDSDFCWMSLFCSLWQAHNVNSFVLILSFIAINDSFKPDADHQLEQSTSVECFYRSNSVNNFNTDYIFRHFRRQKGARALDEMVGPSPPFLLF